MAKDKRVSARGEFEVTELNRMGNLHVEKMGCGYVGLDTGTHDSLVKASDLVRVIPKRRGTVIACLEEIAFHQGLIECDQLMNRGKLFD